MSIRSIGSFGPQRPAAPAPTAPAAPADKAPAVKAGGPPAHAPAHGYRARRDSVAISDAGRALATPGATTGGAAGSATGSATGAAAAAGSAAAGDAKAAGGLTPERVTELRKKVLEGAYNQTSVVDQVARRLLSSGDV